MSDRKRNAHHVGVITGEGALLLGPNMNRGYGVKGGSIRVKILPVKDE